MNRFATLRDRKLVVRALGAMIAALAVASAMVPAAATAREDTVYHVRLVAVRTADTDGSKGWKIAESDLTILVDQVNEIFEDAGIVFDFDPEKDVKDVKNTLLNQDCTVPAGTDMFDQSKKPPCEYLKNDKARESYSLGSLDGAVVVYFRYGTRLKWDDTQQPARWVLTSAGNGAASGGCSHMVLHGQRMIKNTSALPDDSHLLAHELGHYFHCNHTFGPEPKSEAEAAKMIKDYIEAPNPDRPKSEGLNVFDGDGLSDTPPDPGTALFKNLYGDYCTTSKSGVLIHVKFGDGSEKDYFVSPDRGNIMSYYFSCPFGPDHFSAQQIALMRSALENSNRRNLIGLQPNGHVSTKWDDSWTTGWTNVMPFMLDGYPHSLLYKKGDGTVKIIRIKDGAKGATTVWQSGWGNGWTTFMPFTRGGQPHFLVYRSSDGLVRIGRIKNDGKGVVILWSGQWETGWTSFMPFLQDGKVRYLSYKAGNGDVDIGEIHSDGKGVDVIHEESWQTGWTSFMPFRRPKLLFDNSPPYFIIYRSGQGTVRIGQIKDGGQGVSILGSTTWSTGYTHFVPLYRGPQPHFLIYKSGTGAAVIGKIRSDNQGHIHVWGGTWDKGLSAFQTIVGGANFMMTYNKGSGAVATERLCL